VPASESEGLKKVRQYLDRERQRIEQQEHVQMMREIKVLESDPKWHLKLQGARDRVRRKEVAALEAADLQWRKEGSKLMERFLKSGAKVGDGSKADRQFDAGVQAINERLRKAQVAALRQAYDELKKDVEGMMTQIRNENKTAQMRGDAPSEEDLKFLFGP
jgi:hypothetical protein